MRVQKHSNFVGFNIDRQQLEDYIRSVDFDLRDLFLMSSGRVRFGDGIDDAPGENVAGEFQVVADTGSADTEFSISHQLGTVPIGFLVLNIDAGGVVYDSGTAWTDTTIYLKCSAANAAVKLFLIK
jgi:hypothetical protein